MDEFFMCKCDAGDEEITKYYLDDQLMGLPFNRDVAEVI